MRIGNSGAGAAAMVAVVAGMTVPGCGGDDDGGDSKTRPSERPAGKATTLKLESPGGAIAYDKKRLTVPAGRVTIEFANDSERPHNVIVIPGEKLDYKKKAVLGTRVISRLSNETSVKAAGDLKTGAYTYYCSVQNHAALGMAGKLVVR
jgi:plastocyanin